MQEAPSSHLLVIKARRHIPASAPEAPAQLDFRAVLALTCQIHPGINPWLAHLRR